MLKPKMHPAFRATARQSVSQELGADDKLIDINLVRALAPEVRVNAVAPGIIDSPWGIRWTEEKKKVSMQKTLLKRFASPSDIAEVIVSLGFGAAMVTGTTLSVDGGLTLGG